MAARCRTAVAMRRASYLVAALAFLPAAPAVAAPVSCRIVVDARNDEMWLRDVDIPVDRPEVDIVSADVATSSTHLTTVVRVRALPPGPTPATGAQYILRLWGKNGPVETEVRLRSDGTVTGRARRLEPGPSGSTFVVHTIGPAAAALDRSTGEVRATVPLRLMAPYVDVRKGRKMMVRTVLTELFTPDVAAAGQYTAPVSHPADSAEDGPLAYRAGSRSCVRPGA